MIDSAEDVPVVLDTAIAYFNICYDQILTVFATFLHQHAACCLNVHSLPDAETHGKFKARVLQGPYQFQRKSMDYC